MKLIKFRQYNSIHKYWHYWGNFKGPGQFIFPDSSSSYGYQESQLYSGHHDAIGRHIYEGDIVKSYVMEDLSLKKTLTGCVYWAEGGAGLAIDWFSEGYCQFNNLTWSSYCVHGNIFENRELLKVR